MKLKYNLLQKKEALHTHFTLLLLIAISFLFASCGEQQSTVPMQTVSSSLVAEIGYSHIHSELLVRMNNDSLYLYSNVPKTTYTSFLSAPSKGKYFNANIKGKFQTTRIE